MMIRYSPSESRRTFAALAFGFLLAAAPLCAQNDCQPVFDALNKVLRTPTRMYTTTLSNGKPQTTETLYAADGLYTNASGKWIRSETTREQLKKAEEESRKNSAHVCRFLKEEAVNGEKTAVYSTQTGNAGERSDGQIWISRSRGLPVRNEVDVDGGGKGPKKHYTVRYDYKNVTPPKL